MADDETTEESATSKQDKAILSRAHKRFKLCEDFERDNRKEALDDFKFCQLGQQWDAQMLQDRQGRPSLTVNKLAEYVGQVVNEQRQARPRIKVIPGDQQSSPAISDILNGLIRNIEYLSRADMAYDTGFEHAVTGGEGFIGVETCYADEDTFDQDIKVRTFDNCFAVHIDPYCKMPDGSDAEYGFVTDKISREQYKADYGDDYDLETVDVEEEFKEAWYSDDDSCYVREYWERERVPVKLTLGSDGVTRKAGEEIPVGVQVIRERDAYEHKVTMYLLSGHKVLDKSEWPSRYIPIIPVYGKRINVAGKISIRGIVRFAKDPQKMFNWWRTGIAEKLALTPKAPYLVTVKQLEGLENVWQDAANQNLPYLPYNPDPLQPGAPIRAMTDDSVNGMLAANMQADLDIKSATGIHDPQLGKSEAGQSGRAILALQQKSDVSTYGYMDNLSRAIAQVGRIIVDLIPKIYDTERIVRVLGEDGSTDLVKLNERVPAPNGAMQVLNDVTIGKYDVQVITGPGYATKRMESAESMIQFIQAYPSAAPLLGDLIAKNLDWPGSEEVEKRLRAMLPRQLQGEDPVGPIVQQMKQHFEAYKADVEGKIAALESKENVEMAKLAIEREKVGVDREKLEIEKMKISADMAKAEMALVGQNAEIQSKATEAAKGALDWQNEEQNEELSEHDSVRQELGIAIDKPKVIESANDTGMSDDNAGQV